MLASLYLFLVNNSLFNNNNRYEEEISRLRQQLDQVNTRHDRRYSNIANNTDNNNTDNSCSMVVRRRDLPTVVMVVINHPNNMM
jgi:hypothetical protein